MLMRKWKSLSEYDGMYLISNSGEVMSLHNGNKKLLSPCLNRKRGYYYISLMLAAKGMKQNHQLHRLVATIFNPNPSLKPEVNHKDGNKLNNNSTNLEWVTREENQRHARELGLIKTKYGEDCAKAKLTNADVKKIRKLLGKISQRKIADIFNIAPSTVAHIKRGSRWGNVG